MHTYIHVLETATDLSKQTQAHIIFPNAFGKENDSAALLHSLKKHKRKERKKKEKIETLNIRLFISPGDHDERSKKNENERERARKKSVDSNERIKKYLIFFFRLLAYDHTKNKFSSKTDWEK
jgi:hypothetical protein